MKRFISKYPRGLYRSRNGILLGVFTGIAEFLDLSVFWVRITALITLFATGFFPIAFIYIIAALIMKKRPYFSR
jgi:phage shock protein C